MAPFLRRGSICSPAWPPPGDGFFEHAERMKVAGFTSFQPAWSSTNRSETGEEPELSRSVTIEVAKARIAHAAVYAMLHEQIQGAMTAGLQAVLRGAQPARRARGIIGG